MYYVTYVRIYEATPTVVYVGYTPGYLGTVVVALRHRGLRHRLRLLAVDRQRLVRRRPTPTAWPRRRSTTPTSASPTASPSAWPPPPGWSRTGAAPTTTRATGAATAAAPRPAPTSTATGAAPPTRARAAGTPAAAWPAPRRSGNYANARTGTTGSYAAGQQYNAWTGNATRGYDRTANGAGGGSANVARAGNYNTYTGQRSTGSSVSATGAGRQQLRPQRRHHRRARGLRACRRWLHLQRQHRQDQHLEHCECRQQPLRRRQRQRLSQRRQRLAATFVQRLGCGLG